MDLIDVVKQLSDRRNEFELFARGPLAVIAENSRFGILDPSIPEEVKRKIATDIVWGKASGKKPVRIRGLPRDFWPVIDYEGIDRHTSIGEKKFWDVTPLVYVFPDQANVEARIDIALLPKETDELRKFREEEFPVEFGYICKFPGVAVGEPGEGGTERGMPLHRVDTSALEYCKRKYGDRIDFSHPSVQGAVDEIAWFDHLDASGARTEMDQFWGGMMRILLEPYKIGLAQRTNETLQSLNLNGTIDIPPTKSGNLCTGWYVASPEFSRIHTFRQRFDSYRDASQFIDRLYRAFDSETYGRKQDIGFTKVEFKDIPEGHKIYQVQDLLHKESLKRKEAKIITAQV